MLKAGQWNQSHAVLLRHVAADAVINEHYDHLKTFLQELGSPDHCIHITNWDLGGKVYLDYVSMIQSLEQIRSGELNHYELERLQPEVMSLADRVSQMQCYNARDRLCQSEMAKQVSNVMKSLYTMQNPDEAPPARLLAPLIGQLPMPEDYALQELKQLTRTHLMELTRS